MESVPKNRHLVIAHNMSNFKKICNYSISKNLSRYLLSILFCEISMLTYNINFDY